MASLLFLTRCLISRPALRCVVALNVVDSLVGECMWSMLMSEFLRVGPMMIGSLSLLIRFVTLLLGW